MMKKTILETAHESAKDLYNAGIIDRVTMREYDKLCFPEIKKLSPREIKELRLREKISQPVMAQYLNISSSTVKHWETGEKSPGGTSLKLLNLVAQKGLCVLM